MTPAAERYFEELRQMLRARNVPTAAIETNLAVLAASIVDSGSHPYTEFGEPEALANRIAGEHGVVTASRSHTLAIGSYAAAAASLIVDGGIGLAQDHSATFGIEPIFIVGIGAVFALLLWLPKLAGDRWPRYTGPWWSATAIVAAGLAVPATIQVIDRIT